MPSFRLQYASNLFVDLHKQKYDTLVKPICSTLALLGNIGRPRDAKTYHFLNYCSRNWDSILWISGPHELATQTAVKSLSKEFPNVRCLDSEEEVFHSDKTILLGVPPETSSILQKSHRYNLTHTILKTVFWTMTNPMSNIVFLTNSVSSGKELLPIEGSTLETPSFLCLAGGSGKNTLSTDSRGKQFFATNSCFADSRLRKLPSYSPTAFVEFVERDPRVGLMDGNNLSNSLSYRHADPIRF